MQLIYKRAGNDSAGNHCERPASAPRASSRQTLPLLLRIHRCVRNFFEYAAPCIFSVLRTHRTYVHTCTTARKVLERFRIFQNVYTRACESYFNARYKGPSVHRILCILAERFYLRYFFIFFSFYIYLFILSYI